jgi:A/G-specific adenine glycosylase
MNTYRYIIAETLLQRTKAETVAKFYPGFIERFPNWEAINSTHQRTISSYLKPIGLYKQRAARLKKLAKEMVILKGRLPNRKLS